MKIICKNEVGMESSKRAIYTVNITVPLWIPLGILSFYDVCWCCLWITRVWPLWVWKGEGRRVIFGWHLILPTDTQICLAFSSIFICFWVGARLSNVSITPRHVWKISRRSTFILPLGGSSSPKFFFTLIPAVIFTAPSFDFPTYQSLNWKTMWGSQNFVQLC